MKSTGTGRGGRGRRKDGDEGRKKEADEDEEAVDVVNGWRWSEGIKGIGEISGSEKWRKKRI